MYVSCVHIIDAGAVGHFPPSPSLPDLTVCCGRRAQSVHLDRQCVANTAHSKSIPLSYLKWPNLVMVDSPS